MRRFLNFFMNYIVEFNLLMAYNSYKQHKIQILSIEMSEHNCMTASLYARLQNRISTLLNTDCIKNFELGIYFAEIAIISDYNTIILPSIMSIE